MTYSLKDIKKAWQEYGDADAFSVMKEGKWTHTPVRYGVGEVIPKLTGTSCKLQKLENVMEFPEYLEKHYGR